MAAVLIYIHAGFLAAADCMQGVGSHSSSMVPWVGLLCCVLMKHATTAVLMTVVNAHTVHA
jgi:hypothetical protein